MTKILIIEDQPQMRRNISTILELEGYSVLAAGNGKDGLALAHSNKPDVILCDISMPGLDGYAVLTTLRADPATASIPFIFLTAKGEKPDVREGMNLGADDYLTKPFSHTDLLAAIRSRTERRRQLRDMQGLFVSPEPLMRLGLTGREAEVLFWIAQGKSNADIGIILESTEGTVKNKSQASSKNSGWKTAPPRRCAPSKSSAARSKPVAR